MKSQRRPRALQVALVSCLAFAFAQISSPRTQAQEPQKKPDASKPQQTPSPAQQQGREAGEVEIANIDLITLTVTVTDTYGRYVSGLDKKAFKVFEDKVEQEIEYFSD
ncbi:MAG TPA: hypothetical protein VD861_12730, partial [Pyrinomonadaceae bacterium]|nr:hypothetical protein [Pyrinomonadaceae bacterium]